MIRAIAAIDENRGIAKHGAIPWDIPIDSNYFKTQTETGTVIMGRATYEAFDEPLSNRRNLVLSSSLDSLRDGFELLPDFETFLRSETDDVWVIGGAKVYELLLDYCDELYITHIEGDFHCDRFFPAYDEKFSLKTRGAEQTQNGHTFRFDIYVANKKPTLD